MKNKKQLNLYVRDYCMYCNRVLQAVDLFGIDIEIRNIWQNPEYERMLIGATGRRSVPVLEIVENDAASSWMPESEDIIRYLEASPSPG